MAREIIFISHAKPEDNNLVLWLGSRLAAEGYVPWAELSHLVGGSPFWADIEELIRKDAVRVISLLSKHSIATDRAGFRSELSIAHATGKKLGDSKFIIPIKVDDSSEGDFPAQVHQLHALDFSRGWGEGYIELLTTLERSRVPRKDEISSGSLSSWREAHSALPSMVARFPETATSNLLPITKMPERVSIYSFEGSKDTFPKAMKATGLPHAQFHRLCIALADIQHIQELLPPSHQLKPHGQYSVEDFLDGPARDETRPLRADAKNNLSALIRAHIERHLRSRGLIEYEASGQTAFFFPKGLLENDRVNYTTAWKKPSRKNVVGRSEKLGVYWHLAMKVNVSLGEQPLVRFKPYICWSEDGTTAIKDPKQTSAFRKKFCRNWWNPQWRTLQEAFVAFLAEGKPEVSIDLGGFNTMFLSASLATFELARSMPGDLQLADQLEDPEPVDIDEDEPDIEAEEHIE